MGSPLGSP